MKEERLSEERPHDLKMSLCLNEESLWKSVLGNKQYWFQVDIKAHLFDRVHFVAWKYLVFSLSVPDEKCWEEKSGMRKLLSTLKTMYSASCWSIVHSYSKTVVWYLSKQTEDRHPNLPIFPILLCFHWTRTILKETYNFYVL